MTSKRTRRMMTVLGAVAAIVCTGATISALNVSTHGLVNVEAARYEEFTGIIRRTLGFADGRETMLKDRTGLTLSVENWLGTGGFREDDGTRWVNHFHDPRSGSWTFAGLFGIFSSSIHWMQTPNQEGLLYPSWSWLDARRLYTQALTERDPIRREQAAADLFRALGHIMHLMVDAAGPEHSRNDQHLRGVIERGILRNPAYTNYEYWVADQHTRGATAQARAASEAQFKALYLSNPIGFEPLILRIPTLDTRAPVAIARLIDADVYRDTASANVTLMPRPDRPAIGLAEFSNANFFSENTLNNDEYPHPLSDNLPPSLWATPRGRVRKYFAKRPGDGLAVDPVIGECVTEHLRRMRAEPVLITEPYRCVDENVWQQTALHMLPRAVGYARGVLDYFFRGGLEVRAVTVNANGVFIDLENTSDEPLEGVVEIHARYQAGTPLEQRQRMAVLNDGHPISLGPFSTARYPFPPPEGPPSAYHVLAFRGRQGLEEDAVIGRMFTVPRVDVVQESYDADISQTCAPRPFSSDVAFGEQLICNWEPINHRVPGRIVTNFAGSDPADPTTLVIDRVQAVWRGRLGTFPVPAPIPAPIAVDGVPYPSGVWTRGDEDSDPASFLVLDPAARDARELWVTVSVRDDTRYEFSTQTTTFSWQLATFNATTAVATKSAFEFRDPVLGADGSWRVVASRSWRVEPNVLLSFFRPQSIGGFPVPTIRTTATDSLVVTATRGVYTVTDFFQPVASRSATAAVLAGITLELPFPEPPDLHWSAVVSSLPPQPPLVQFRQTFVTDDPWPVTFTMTARGGP